MTYSWAMHRLERTLRFAVNPDDPVGVGTSGVNGFGGIPAMRGLGRHYELDITCEGEPDAITGYLINIKRIDEAARSALVPMIARACRESPATEPQFLLPSLAAALARALPIARRVRWRLSPTYSVETSMNDTTHAIIRQQFDFAAAHRLHVPSVSDAENLAMFGKCNNPRGHGHNYRMEVAVRVPTGSGGGRAFTLADIEAAAQAAVIDRFDHTHLNEDTREFATLGGLNPSVENIARVCHELLSPAVRERSNATASLESVTVWETDRTSATYPG